MAAVGEGQTAPELQVRERLALAYPRVDVAWGLSDSSRATDGDTSVWPEMRYLGEEGPIGSVTVTPQEIRIVPGRSIPMLYSPEHDEMVDAPTGSPSWDERPPDRPGLVIPPNASLVMVRIETDPALGHWAGRGQFVCADEGYLEVRLQQQLLPNFVSGPWRKASHSSRAIGSGSGSTRALRAARARRAAGCTSSSRDWTWTPPCSGWNTWPVRNPDSWHSGRSRRGLRVRRAWKRLFIGQAAGRVCPAYGGGFHARLEPESGT